MGQESYFPDVTEIAWPTLAMNKKTGIQGQKASGPRGPREIDTHQEPEEWIQGFREDLQN